MLKFESVATLSSEAALLYASVHRSWHLLWRSENRLPKLFSL